jgi:hypothetical protein
MGVTAVAELLADAPLAVAFAHFSDFSTWDRWMPANFQPLGGPARRLRAGDRVKIGLGPKGRLPLELEVIRVRLDKEVCWRAGIPGVLMGEHSILFSERDGKTRLRSEEPVTGLLTLGLLGRWVERDFTRVGTSILERFAAYVARAT